MILKIHISFLIALLYNLYIGKKQVYFIAYMFIIMHELSHMIVALLLNVDIEEIILLPFGVTARYKGTINLIQEFLIAIAGPLASFIFAFLYNNDIYLKINFLIILFNIIPIYPLDGGRIIRVFLILVFKQKIGYKLSLLINKICILLLIAFSFYLLLKNNNYPLFILSIYILKVSEEQIKKEKIHQLINYLQINK